MRLATRDDAAQFRKTEKLLCGKFSPSAPAWISVIVVVEYAWVLARLYQYSREEIAKTLSALIETDCFRVGDRNLVRSAIQPYPEAKADYSDSLILVRNQENGAEIIHTFDRKAAKLRGFRLIADTWNLTGYGSRKAAFHPTVRGAARR